MTWKTPKTNWTSEDIVTDNDFNRIEGNIDYAMGLVEPGKNLLKRTIVANGVTMVTNTPTFQELADGINKIAPNVTTTDALSSQILSGKKAVVQNKLVTGSMVDRGKREMRLTKDLESYIIPKGYHDGTGFVKTNISNLYAKNIKLGENVGGVSGGYGFKLISYMNKDDGKTTSLPSEIAMTDYALIGANREITTHTTTLGWKPSGLIFSYHNHNFSNLYEGLETTELKLTGNWTGNVRMGDYVNDNEYHLLEVTFTSTGYSLKFKGRGKKYTDYADMVVLAYKI